MQFENPMTFVRAIKGAPSSVLWALMFTKQMMTALELQQWTGYKGDNLTVALRLLVDLGWVVARSSRGPWALAEGRQLPLMDFFLEENGSDKKFEKPESDLIGFRDGVVDDGTIKVFSPTITTTSLTSGRATPIKSESENTREKACFALLAEAGIHGKKAKQLVKLDWVTPEYIQAHFEQVKRETWDNPQGMMIYRIEGEVPAESAPAEKTYGVKTVDGGKYRKSERIVYTFDVNAHIAEFMSHEVGCSCIDCEMIRSMNGDTRIVCHTCKHHACTCEESEEE
jgi:hypothetical protein